MSGIVTHCLGLRRDASSGVTQLRALIDPQQCKGPSEKEPDPDLCPTVVRGEQRASEKMEVFASTLVNTHRVKDVCKA